MKGNSRTQPQDGTTWSIRSVSAKRELIPATLTAQRYARFWDASQHMLVHRMMALALFDLSNSSALTARFVVSSRTIKRG
ncbi:hypothetical protein WS66_24310 [Burkholderia sp. LA-2-3-30-S1-D2]|nr:hypothetical protein WS66_24310 [Burkholderia sp. LA-2-3-30-S1-D2]KVE13309.1 hypothetical protein WS66_15035 [Burkholderia sp. LA-2-3-30-S1-D2]